MKNLYALLILLLSFQISAAQEINENQKIATSIKIWGFLKYYHPEVASGKFDWDEQLAKLIALTEKATNKEELSSVYVDWMKKLGPINKQKTNSDIKNKYINKNFDLSWTQNNIFLSNELAQLLKNIEENRHKKKQYYVKANKVGGVEIINEKEYKEFDWTKKELRLITLARYWNIIEYFYPYKYATDKKWDDVLMDMIPKFINPKTEEEFHLAMLELVVCIDDSHGVFVTPVTNKYFGNKWQSARFDIIDNNAVVTSFHNDSLAKKNDIQIGDVISKVDGKSINELLLKNRRYTTASNERIKLNNNYYSIFKGNADFMLVEVERNGVISTKKYNSYLWEDLKFKNPVKEKWKLINDSIGYVNMNDLIITDVDQMMKELNGTKTIIFDIRSYSNSTLYTIARYIVPNNTPFVKFTNADLTYPGKFKWTKEKVCGTSNEKKYKGKVILLVDEETQSHAEFTAMAFQKAENAITIGSQTAGADGNVSEIRLAGGFWSLMTGIGVYYPDESETQRVGIKVDVEVKPTIKGIKEGRDEVLEKAIELSNK
ncbi:MAG: S41 family peptidase [Bacteroidota bacterium]